MSIPRSVVDCQPARRVPEESYNDSRKLGASSGIQAREGIEKSGSEEPLQPLPLPCFFGKRQGKSLDDRNGLKSMAHHAAGIGTCTQSGMINPSYPTSEMHLVKCPDHTEFQSWIVNFRTEVCSKTKNPTRALQWIKEIEAAKSLDDLMMMASALRWCYDEQTYFRKKISVEEQKAQRDSRFLRGRHIAYSIFEYFRPTGSCDEIQGLSGLFSIKLENDDIQDFELRWEQALLLTSDPPSDKVLEGLYVSNLQDSFQILQEYTSIIHVSSKS